MARMIQSMTFSFLVTSYKLFHFDERGIKRRCPADIRQPLAGESVHVVGLRVQLGPVKARSHHTCGHASVYESIQCKRAAIIEDAHAIAVRNAARCGVL